MLVQGNSLIPDTQERGAAMYEHCAKSHNARWQQTTEMEEKSLQQDAIHCCSLISDVSLQGCKKTHGMFTW